MAKFEGRGACDCCAKGVDVYSDKNGLAYYNCGPCGFRGLHRSARTSAAFLNRIDRHAEADDGAPPAEAGTLGGPIVPAPARAPARKPEPAPAAPPAQKKRSFLDNLTL